MGSRFYGKEKPMPRLIDADDIWYDLLENTGNKEHPLEWAVSQSRIDRMPTIDAVEVIRCRYCRGWNRENGYCVDFLVTDPNGYCSFGERKE